MSTFAEIKAAIRSNLNDAGVVYYSEADLIESLEDAYADVLFLSRCYIRKITLDFQNSPYYDFKSLGAEDFMCVIAIFNNNTNRWLDDSLTVRDLDNIRIDWELWEGEPKIWCGLNLDLTVLVPCSSSPTGDFDLYYAAKVADITDDSLTPLIATDMQSLLESYCTGDLLEQAEEYTKATQYFTEYYESLEEYTSRVRLLAKSDLLLKI